MYSPYAHMLVADTLRNEIASADQRVEEERKRRETHAATMRALGVMNMDQLLVKHFGVDTPKELEVFRAPPKAQPPKQEAANGQPSTAPTRFPPPPLARSGR